METNGTRNVTFLTISRLVSLFGSGVQNIAIPLYILDRTGSASIMGLFSMAAVVPALLFAPVAGVLGDKFNRRMLLVITDVVRFTVVGFLAVLAALKTLHLVVLFMVQICISLSDCLFNSCSDGILPDLVSAENLHKANAAKGSSDAVASILGPVFGGIIYGVSSILPVFIINAFSFGLSGVFELLIRYKKTTTDVEKLTIRTFVDRIKYTLMFIYYNKTIKQLFFMGTLLFFLIYPMLNVVMPFVVRKTIGFSSTQMGLMFAFLMGGVLIGNIVTAGLFNRVKTKVLMRSGLVIEVILILIFGSMTLPFVMKALGGASILFFFLVCLLLLLIGFFCIWILMPVNVNIQKIVPNEMRSRFFSIFNLATQAAVPLSALIYGILLDHLDSFIIVFAVGVFVAIAALNMMYRANEDLYDPLGKDKQNAS